MNPDELQSLAHWLGGFALPLFLVLLCALVLTAAFGAWAWRAHLLPRTRAALPQPALLLVYAAGGFAIVIAAAAGFATIASGLGAGGAMGAFDEALAASVRAHVGAGTLRAFALLTHLGDPLALTLLGGVVALWLWRRRQRALALGWVLALTGNALLNPALKRVFERIRPLHEHGLASAEGFSFPSGHTSGATVAYGMLAYVLLRALPVHLPGSGKPEVAWRLALPMAAVAIAFSVGCSRIFLGVHYASDGAGGFASGTAWLAVCILSVELTLRRRARLGRERG